jgi:GGDEF domain-containing protein
MVDDPIARAIERMRAQQGVGTEEESDPFSAAVSRMRMKATTSTDEEEPGLVRRALQAARRGIGAVGEAMEGPGSQFLPPGSDAIRQLGRAARSPAAEYITDELDPESAGHGALAGLAMGGAGLLDMAGGILEGPSAEGRFSAIAPREGSPAKRAGEFIRGPVSGHPLDFLRSDYARAAADIHRDSAGESIEAVVGEVVGSMAAEVAPYLAGGAAVAARLPQGLSTGARWARVLAGEAAVGVPLDVIQGFTRRPEETMAGAAATMLADPEMRDKVAEVIPGLTPGMVDWVFQNAERANETEWGRAVFEVAFGLSIGLPIGTVSEFIGPIRTRIASSLRTAPPPTREAVAAVGDLDPRVLSEAEGAVGVGPQGRVEELLDELDVTPRMPGENVLDLSDSPAIGADAGRVPEPGVVLPEPSGPRGTVRLPSVDAEASAVIEEASRLATDPTIIRALPEGVEPDIIPSSAAILAREEAAGRSLTPDQARFMESLRNRARGESGAVDPALVSAVARSMAASGLGAGVGAAIAPEGMELEGAVAGAALPALGLRGVRRRIADVIDPSRARELAQAYTDPMTGLANQTAFRRAQPKMDADPDITYVAADITNLKGLNDIEGEALADNFISQVGRSLSEIAEDAGVAPRDVFRAGGDEFAIGVRGGPERVAAVVSAIQSRAPNRVISGSGGMRAGLRVGVGDTWHTAAASMQTAKKGETGARYRDTRNLLATDSSRGGLRSVQSQATEYIDTVRPELRSGYPDEPRYLELPEGDGYLVADLYESAPMRDPRPEVAQSYEALKRETYDQFVFLKERGVNLIPWDRAGQPYKNSAEMMADIRDNNRLFFFPTEEGFGEGAEAAARNHPLLEGSGVVLGGREMVYNDLFRAVHDYFGHAKEGFQFGPRGEHNAWGIHSSMYTPEARGAMGWETRAQNSWVNFGPHLRNQKGVVPRSGEPGFKPLTDRPYAPQKVGTLPPRFTSVEASDVARLDVRARETAGSVPDPDTTPIVRALDEVAAQGEKALNGDPRAGFTTRSMTGAVTRVGGGGLLGGIIGARTAEDEGNAAGRFWAGALLGAGIGLGATPGARRVVGESYHYRRFLSSDGLLGTVRMGGNIVHTGASAVRRRARALMSAQVKDSEFLYADFNRALKEEYNTSIRKLDTDTRDGIRAAMENSRATGNLKPRTLAAVKAMRSHIDNLSARFKEEGLIDGDVVATFDNNMGMYLNRAYRAFDSPTRWRKFLEKTPEGQQIVNKFRSWALDEYGGSMPANQIDAILSDALAKADSPIAFLANMPGGVRQNLSILRKRQGVPPELRALWGEYEDPISNYMRSVYKMTHLLETNRMLRDIAREGEGKFLFRRENFPENASGLDLVPLSPADAPNRALGALSEFYAPREFQEALLRHTSNTSSLPPYLRQAIALANASKYAKTVLSPFPTGVRNVMGSVLFIWSQGNLSRALLDGSFIEGFRSAYGTGVGKGKGRLVKTSFAKHVGGDAGLEQQAYYKTLTELGVVDESVRAGELDWYMREIFDGMYRPPDVGAWNKSANKVRDMLRKGGDFSTSLYRAGDDFAKITAFESEFGRLTRANVPAKEAAIRAAEIVTNTLPTYSRVAEGVRNLREFPLLGSFVSFPYEVYRTSFNSVRQIQSEIFNPNLTSEQIAQAIASGNIGSVLNPDKGIRAIGFDRLAGALSMIAASTAGISAVKLQMGWTKEEENALRRQLPWWSRNSQIIPFAREQGEDGQTRFSFSDISYTDPYAYMKKPLVAFLRGEKWEDTLKETFAELLLPFAAEEIWVQQGRKLISDLSRNPDVSAVRKARFAAGRLAGSIEPGASVMASRVLAGHTQRSLENFIAGDIGGAPVGRRAELSALVGLRITNYDPAESMPYILREYSSRRNAARREINRTFDADGGLSISTWRATGVPGVRDVVPPGAPFRGTIEDWKHTENSILLDYKQMFKDALTFGMSAEAVVKMFRDSGISPTELSRILTAEQGELPPRPWPVVGN